MLRTVLLIAVTALGLTACDKVTQENYDKIGIGDSYQDAVAILGDPTECDSIVNTKTCTWGDDRKFIKARIIGESIVFLNSEGLD